MSNFIFFSDPHLRLTATRRRTDDMFKSQLAKLSHIAKRANELKSEFVVCTGDFGDSWDWRLSMINQVADVLREFPCPVYTIIGNHDVPGRNPELWKDTGIGLLDSLGVLQVLHPNSKNGLLEYTNGCRVPNTIEDFALVPFHSDAKDTDDLINGKIVPIPPVGKVKVAIVHAPIGAETTPYSKGVKELFINGYDLALFGDIHTGWPIYNSITGCIICNPGSLIRLSKVDMERIPMIGIVTYEDELKVVYEEVLHIPYADCFSIDKMQAELEDLGKGFLAAIAAKKAVGDLDPKAYVALIGKAAGYSDQAVKILQNEIQL